MQKLTFTILLFFCSVSLLQLQANDDVNHHAEVTPFVNGSPKLLPNQSLKANQFLLSYNRKYKLIYQSDGNLVIYLLKGSSQTAIWDTQTNGKSVGQVIMQSDGNLVMYDASGTAVWASHTWAPNRGAFAQMRNDGNLVVYWPNLHILWKSNSGRYNFYGGSVLYAGQALLKGQRVQSNNRKYFLSFQHDGNLVLYRAADKHVLWTAGTHNQNGIVTVLHHNGNLCVYSGHHSLHSLLGPTSAATPVSQRSPNIWCSGSGHPYNGSVRLQVENDGKVIIYAASRKIWVRP